LKLMDWLEHIVGGMGVFTHIKLDSRYYDTTISVFSFLFRRNSLESKIRLGERRGNVITLLQFKKYTEI
jgi:hypothetical protein